LIVAAVALAGCGGGGGSGALTAGTTVGTTVSTTSGVAGVQTTKASASFRTRVQSIETQLQAAVQKLDNGNLTGAASAGGSLLTHCRSTVNSKLATQAKTPAQREAVSHLRLACKDMAKATSKGASGNMAAAKQLAQQALNEVKTALKPLH
jgi:uncharacterized UPF0160 family protein